MVEAGPNADELPVPAAASGEEKMGTKERLLVAAGPIFAQHGFDRATVREICDAAGANVASIHYHFGDKWGLYVATVEEAHRLLNDAVPPPDWNSEISPHEKLAGFVRVMFLRMMDVHGIGWPAELLLREIVSPTAVCDSLIERSFRSHFEALLITIGELVSQPVQRDELERLAFAVIAQCFHHRMAGPFLKRISTVPAEQRDDLEAAIAHVTRFSLTAITQWSSAGETLPTTNVSRMESRPVERVPSPVHRLDSSKSVGALTPPAHHVHQPHLQSSPDRSLEQSSR